MDVGFGTAVLRGIFAGWLIALVVFMNGTISWQRSMAGYMLPSLLGNIIGGVTLVSALNHAQVIPPRVKD